MGGGKGGDSGQGWGGGGGNSLTWRAITPRCYTSSSSCSRVHDHHDFMGLHRCCEAGYIRYKNEKLQMLINLFNLISKFENFCYFIHNFENEKN